MRNLTWIRKALEFIDEVRNHASDRFSVMVAPGQIDTCTSEPIMASYEAAVERQLHWTAHAAQSVVEFREIFRRHGKTPIEWLESLGVLGPYLTTGNAIYCDHHGWLCWPDRLDLDRIASSDVTSFIACDANYLIDNKLGVIVDAEGSRANRTNEIAVSVHPRRAQTAMAQNRDSSHGFSQPPPSEVRAA